MTVEFQDRRRRQDDSLETMIVEIRELAKAQTATAAGLADHLRYCLNKGEQDISNQKRTRRWRKKANKANNELRKTIWRGVMWVLGAETVAISFLVFFLITGHRP